MKETLLDISKIQRPPPRRFFGVLQMWNAASKKKEYNFIFLLPRIQMDCL